ncbi:MAG: capsular biosynthesis protein [Rhizobiaceae bacterium]|nr:capsular biosynthesis protein [Rhizobiaceae bacterium]
MSKRVFLFLQGHPSQFTRSLVKEFSTHGHTSKIINFSITDWIYRCGLGADNYWGKVSNWQIYLSKYIEKHGITDIIYYADQRPYHRIARAIAYSQGINVFTYEFGYLRPDWITLEKGGMGVFSHFPDDPELIRELAKNIKCDWPEGNYPYPFYIEAINEVFYNMAPLLFPYLYPHYQRDRFYHPFIEYPCYVPRLLRSKKNNKIADDVINNLIKSKDEYFVVPLQLQADYQIRRASPYTHIKQMVIEVLSSFSEHAPKNAKLVFKLHPLDNNIENWPKNIKAIAQEHRCLDRVQVIDGGNLDKLLLYSNGNVLINSTTGIAALQMGIPTKVLGIAIFDVHGMTDHRPLHEFWKTPLKPDENLVKDFMNLMVASVQLKGNFFTKVGKSTAAKNIVDRILADNVNSHGTFISPPPRLKKAREIGVPITFDQMEPPI